MNTKMKLENKPCATVSESDVVGISLPHCAHGFRAGLAYATVNGVLVKIHTSESDQLPYEAHLAIVRAKLAAGEGETV